MVHSTVLMLLKYELNWENTTEGLVYGQKSFLSKGSETKILQSIYFAHEVGIISSYSNRIWRLRCEIARTVTAIWISCN